MMKLSFLMAAGIVGVILSLSGAILLGVALTPAKVSEGPRIGSRVGPGVAGQIGRVGTPEDWNLTSQDTVTFNVDFHGIGEMYIFDYRSAIPYNYNATIFLQNLAASPQPVVFSKLLLYGSYSFDFVPPTGSVYLIDFVNPTSVPTTFNMTMTTYHQPIQIDTYRTSGLIVSAAGIALVLATVIWSIAARTTNKAQQSGTTHRANSRT